MMLIRGLAVIFLGLAVGVKMEGAQLYMLYSASSLWVVVVVSIGATLVSHRPQEIWSAFVTCIKFDIIKNKYSEQTDTATLDIRTSKEDFLPDAKIFCTLSTYSVKAGWLFFIIGLIHIFGSIENIDYLKERFGKYSAGFALNFVSLFWGYFFSIIFSSMKDNLEMKANLTSEQ